ncbi:hypothetical protein RHMOL_Rhmol12G0241400 [Rhododendron molle]|uniref:Uncharacterized protein n=1 Tax=Rhododendron molle TaxID=49168 RepID=A0ACC0LM05_RHOML|nr:hypothetical protein RHMOL_Rhmol12G0241400 [Rhododendron molle]
MEEVFWLPVEPKWFNLSSQLVDLELQQCVNETNCLPETPQVVYGLRASTADIFLDNAAYRKYLFSKFNVSTVDEESSAVLMVDIHYKMECHALYFVGFRIWLGQQQGRNRHQDYYHQVA